MATGTGAGFPGHVARLQFFLMYYTLGVSHRLAPEVATEWVLLQQRQMVLNWRLRGHQNLVHSELFFSTLSTRLARSLSRENTFVRKIKALQDGQLTKRGSFSWPCSAWCVAYHSGQSSPCSSKLSSEKSIKYLFSSDIIRRSEPHPPCNSQHFLRLSLSRSHSLAPFIYLTITDSAVWNAWKVVTH